jgi:hypothetical protein
MRRSRFAPEFACDTRGQVAHGLGEQHQTGRSENREENDFFICIRDAGCVGSALGCGFLTQFALLQSLIVGFRPYTMQGGVVLLAACTPESRT